MQDDILPSDVQRNLGLSSDMMRWLERTERPGASPAPQLPGNDEAIYLMERLEVKPADQTDILAARPDPVAQPELWWVLSQIYADMLANMGQGEPVTGFQVWPGLPASLGASGRHLYVWLYLAVLPEVRRFHTERGVPDDVSWTTLTALGRAVDEARSLNGVSGLSLRGQWSVPMRFRGADYELGRLSFNRGEFSILGRTHSYVLNVHIPPLGPLDAASCDDSFSRAREFFPRYFSEEPLSFFVCESWLMDDQLAAYLPENSNLMRFQRRFRLLPEKEPMRSDDDILRYIFGRAHDGPQLPSSLLDELPQDTTLQRSFVAHLRAGKHWYARTGWTVF